MTTATLKALSIVRKTLTIIANVVFMRLNHRNVTWALCRQCLILGGTDMTFKAKYIQRNNDNPLVYWRTIRADSVNEASRIAERFTRKYYLLISVKEYA